jgi:hypothetical protein
LGKESKYFVTQWTLLEQSIFSVSRISGFIEETASEETGDTLLPPAGWPQQGSIEFKDVYACYRFVSFTNPNPELFC